jgi:hypothetical protein
MEVNKVIVMGMKEIIDANALIGLSEKAANAIISRYKMISRVSKRDDKSYIMSMELRSDRVTMQIKDGLVTEAKIQ